MVLYYLQTRYYDAKLCRFINPDSIMSSANGSLHGYNLYAYCFNNPVNMNDMSGNWPNWNKIWNGIGDFFENIGDAVVSSFELKIGFGIGIGFGLFDFIDLEASRETYVGVDDGQLITGNEITLQAVTFETIGVGGTYDHLVEKGGHRISSSGSAADSPFDMIGYSDTQSDPIIAFGPISFNREVEVLFSFNASVYVGAGMSFNLSYNVTEFFVRLFD